jgi:hypothetical protein
MSGLALDPCRVRAWTDGRPATMSHPAVPGGDGRRHDRESGESGHPDSPALAMSSTAVCDRSFWITLFYAHVSVRH